MPLEMNKKMMLTSSALVLSGLLAVSTSTVSAAEVDTEKPVDTEAIQPVADVSVPVDTKEVPEVTAEDVAEALPTSDENTTETETTVNVDEATSDQTDTDIVTPDRPTETDSKEVADDTATDNVEIPADEGDPETLNGPSHDEIVNKVDEIKNDKAASDESLETAISRGEEAIANIDKAQANAKASDKEVETAKGDPLVSEKPDYVVPSKRDINYERLADFMKNHRQTFNKLIEIGSEVATLGKDEVTSSERIIELGQIIMDDSIDSEVLYDVAAFITQFPDYKDVTLTPGALDGSRYDENPLFESLTPPGNTPKLEDWTIGDDKEINIEDLVKKGMSVSDAVMTVIDSRLNGKVSTAEIGSIIDTVTPTGSLFHDIGALIERVAYLHANAKREDVLKGTEIVGVIAELVPTEVTLNGTPVRYVIDKLGSMAQDIGQSVIKGMVSFFEPGNFYNVNTWRLRAQLFVEAAKAIHTATHDWTRKPQIVHSKAGLEITHAFMAVVDPFSNVERLTKRIKDMQGLVAYGNNFRDITPLDIATTYVKRALADTIWQTRFDRDEYILSKVPFEVYHELNKAITKAVGVQLNPETLVFEIDNAIANLKGAYQKAIDYLNSIPKEEQIAPNQLKRDLKDLIWQTRFDRDKYVLGKVPTEVYTNLNKVITKAVGLQLKVKSKTVDVEAVMDELKTTLADAKAQAEDVQANKASFSFKRELADLIWQTRRERDQFVLGKVPSDVYTNLNKVITAAVGVQLAVNATNGEVTQAMDSLKNALAKAKEIASAKVATVTA